METKTLTAQVKEALKVAKTCVIEIRSPMGNAAGQRLLKALRLAGVKTDLIEVTATPNPGILIETCPECAAIGLAVQTGFGTAGLEAHLLVQTTRIPNKVIIHLGSAEPPSKTPK
jgi:hypothetical protein